MEILVKMRKKNIIYFACSSHQSSNFRKMCNKLSHPFGKTTNVKLNQNIRISNLNLIQEVCFTNMRNLFINPNESSSVQHPSVRHISSTQKGRSFSAPKIPQFHIKNPSVQHIPQFHTKRCLKLRGFGVELRGFWC